MIDKFGKNSCVNPLFFQNSSYAEYTIKITPDYPLSRHQVAWIAPPVRMVACMSRVFIYHRNCLFRDCLATFIRTTRRDTAISVDHGVSAVEESIGDRADILLIDLNLPNDLALEIVRTAKEFCPNARILILVPDDHRCLIECVRQGVHGCVFESSSLEELNEAIDRVLNGEVFCSANFAGTILSELPRFGENWQSSVSLNRPRLTFREQQVLQLIGERKSNKQIAKELCVSLYTVKNHVHNLLEKLNAETRVDAVEIASNYERLSWR